VEGRAGPHAPLARVHQSGVSSQRLLTITVALADNGADRGRVSSNEQRSPLLSDVIDDARTSIEHRLHELETESERLRKALAGLPRTGRNNGAPTRRRQRQAPRSRAGRGMRQEQFLNELRKTPGAKVPEIAKAIGVSPNQAYGLAKRLHGSGQIRKQRGGGYALKA
jgi:hypothetical protein